MRVAWLVALGALAAPATVAADSFAPIHLAVRVPAVTRADRGTPVTVTVTADANALDFRQGAVRAEVRLTTGECGGTFAGTSGPVLLQRTLAPQPSPGRAYRGVVHGSTRIRGYGSYVVCAYLDDDYQQLATATGTPAVTVSRSCTRAAAAYDRAVHSRRVPRARRAALRRAARRACGAGVAL